MLIKRHQKDDMMRDPLSSAHAKCVSTFQEREEVPVMAIVGGFDIHRIILSPDLDHGLDLCGCVVDGVLDAGLGSWLSTFR